jgi:dTDP-4-amino-4,6-dideoxygalactose transaminase
MASKSRELKFPPIRKPLPPIPFIDLGAHHQPFKKAFLKKVAELIDRSEFILGAEVDAFEKEFAVYCGGSIGVGVSNGYDAIRLTLEAMGIGAGDEVVIPAFTFAATAFGVSHAGATPRFVDVDPETYTMDPGKLASAITPRTKAVMPVHLFGHPADLDPILAIARKRGLKVIEDAAQAHGATYRGKRVGALADAGCFSFYPSKNLGALGDAGMVVTSDGSLAERIRLLRNCGSKVRYVHDAVGYNNRLDNLQAAFLRVKLKGLDRANDRRRKAAKEYGRYLDEMAPVVRDWAGHVYHLYVIRSDQRDGIKERLAKSGIPTGVYYPIPLHLQPCYRGLGGKEGDFPVSEKVAREVLALPMYPELTPVLVRRIAGSVLA